MLTAEQKNNIAGIPLSTYLIEANVWLKLAIFRLPNQVRWRSAVMAPQDFGQANGREELWTNEGT